MTLEPLPSDRIRARRRPALVVLYHLHRALLSVVLAAPIATALAGAVRHRPGGERALFEPGAVLLLEAARLARSTIEATGTQAVILCLAWALLGLVPLAWLLAALGHAGSAGAAAVAQRVARSVGTLAVMLALAACVSVLVGVIFIVLGEAAVQRSGLAPPSADVLRVAILALGALAIAVIGVVHDLARAAAVDEERGLYDATRIALVAFKHSPVRALWAWGWRAGVGLAAGAVALVLAGPFAPAASLPGEMMLRHATLLLVTCLRASWLAAALRLVAPARRHQPAASS